MAKRKVLNEESSSEDSSPSSVNGADYTDQECSSSAAAAVAAGDWRSLSWAFGLGPSNRGYRGRRMRRAPTKGGGRMRSEEENEPELMKELLDIVLWNDEREIDMNEDEETDDDDDPLEYIKRSMAREETLRPRRPVGAAAVAVEEKRNAGVVKLSSQFSVSTLRFDSRLRLDSRANISDDNSVQTASMARFERTTTMDRAFQGVLEDRYISEGQRSIDKGEKVDQKSATTPTTAAASEDSENFWDDVEF